MSDKYINTNYSLSTICDFNKYNLSKKDNFINIEYLDTSNITENNINKLIIYDIKHAPSRAKRKVKDKTIIYSTVRPIQKHFGILKNPKDNMIVSTGFITIDLKKEFIHIIDEYYIYYLITQNSITEYLQTIAEGSVSAYPSITSDDIINLRFSFPKIEYQKQIANYLLQIDKKIQLNNLIYSELEKMAKTLYDYWFVQFDFPDENGRPYKSSGGKMVWNNELKKEIPYGWEVKNIDNILSNRQVKSITPDANTLYKYYSLPSVAKSKSYELEYGKNILSSKYIVDNDCVLINKLNPLDSRVVYVPNEANQICSTEFIVLKQTNHFIKSFIYSILSSDHFQLYCKQRISGAIHKRVSPRLVYDYKFPYNNSLVNNFGKIILNLLEKKTGLIKQNQDLTSLRDFLLPLLMNGQAVIKE